MKKWLLIGLILLTSGFVAFSQVFWSSNLNKKHPLYLKITEINNTNSDSVTRLSIDLIGIPHTSSRIDSAHIKRKNGDLFVASDIDGVDFNRYFQWEEDGKISIELDFPQHEDYCEKDTLIIFTVYGSSRTIVTTD